MQFISLLVGKTILRILRLTGRTGSALPGLVIEKIQPNFLNKMLDSLPGGVVVITGTNGKTTTTKSVAALLQAHGQRVLTNKTGSNFVRGIIATVIDSAQLNGELPFDIAILEQDEAHAVRLVEKVKPKGVVVLNIMRDQMDRFGEIDTTAKLLSQVTASAKEWVVLNANDRRVAKLLPPRNVRTFWYGHSEQLQKNFLTDDELHHHDNLDFFKADAMNVELTAYDSISASLRIGSNTRKFIMPLTGSHNAINFSAVIAILYAIIPDADLVVTEKAVENLKPAFGRGETLHLSGGQSITLQLVKNPAGFTHALRLLDLNSYAVAALVINDDYADGRDVSWLWDVEFAGLNKDDLITYCGGVRGYDMAVRLKYDNVRTKKTFRNLNRLVMTVNQASSPDRPTIIFCTYTAMLKIRKLYKALSPDITGDME